MIHIDAQGNERYTHDGNIKATTWLAWMIECTDPFQDLGIGCCGVCPPDASEQLENGEFPFADND